MGRRTAASSQNDRTAPRALRQRAGLSLMKAAAAAGVCETTARVYEASRVAVSEKPRAALDAYYAQLAATLAGASASRSGGPQAA